ncbi:MAG TPA: hypothetical protein VLM40_18680, partial [Gemmata sp.]|nr:hypothetical protein [Gemmata sp.]
MTNLLNVARSAVVREDAGAIVRLFGHPQTNHSLRRKGTRRAGPQIFALRLNPRFVGRVLETARLGEFIGPGSSVRGELRIPRQRRDAHRRALGIVGRQNALVEVSAKRRAADQQWAAGERCESNEQAG